MACAAQKASEPMAAAELYQSQWFRGARAYARSRCDGWYILSAQHGLVAPGQRIAPYDRTLNELSIAERRAWAARVLAQLAALEQLDAPSTRFVLLAGARYREQLEPALAGRVEVPMRGLGIGQQLAWLKRAQQRSSA